MTPNGWWQTLLFLAAVGLLVQPLGRYMARVYDGEATRLDPICGPLERIIYRLAGVQPSVGMTWPTYALAMLAFNGVGALMVYLVQRLQGILPLNATGLSGVPPVVAFNTAASFVSNTNWQAYGGESTMTNLTQMAALTVQNFVSAASGMATLVAFIRGLRAREGHLLGNFWQDLVRGTLYVLLPLSLLFALLLVSQGVVQTFAATRSIEPVQPIVTAVDVPLGPVASQVAIKQLGTNGGGFFNVNSAHPFENPTPLSNFLELVAILLLPAALCYTFGAMVGDTRQGWALLAAMTVLFCALLLPALWAEHAGNPRLAALGVAGGMNMEGKEVRVGVTNSVLWAIATTAASNGSVNAMHDSLLPLTGMATMFMMQLGEVVFGGVGSGLYGMLIFVIVAVFVSGLMVGRTPEYLGKKIEAYEMKMAMLVILIPAVLVLVGTALGVGTDAGRAARQATGAHGFSEVLYAFTSMGNNNGSAFGGLTANGPFYGLTGGVVMLFARYWLAVPVLAIAGSLARKKRIPAGPGTLPTDTPLFAMILVGIVVLVGALTFIPALALGPVVEHLVLYARGGS